MIIIIDFGSQTTHLIARRHKELGAGVEIIHPENALKEIKKNKAKGIILSGGPASVYEKMLKLLMIKFSVWEFQF